MIRLIRRVAAACGLVLATLAAAHAQDYPSRPIQLVIPYVAGGGSDALARVLAAELGARLGQPVVPENKPGAATMLAAGQVARSAPDGYTLLIGTMAHSLAPLTHAQMAYDAVNDFEFIGKVGHFGFLVVTRPQLKVNDLQGLVDLMRAQPGKLQFGSAGMGSPMHLGGEYLKYLAKADAVHVPYKGEGAALIDLLGGHIDFMLCTVATCAQRVRDGAIKALAVPSPRRSPLAPAVPTTAEAGLPAYQIYTWVFLAAPRGTPPAIVQRLNKALNEALADGKFRSRVTAMGVDLESSSSPAAMKALVQSEIDKWRPIVKASGMTAE